MTGLSQKNIILIILLFILLACSNSNSITAQTTETNYDVIATQAMGQAQTMVSFTQTAMPSNTPEPTKTARPPIVMKLFDDFNNDWFDDSTDSIKWRSFFNSRCEAFQKNGSLIITDTYKYGDVDISSCDLIASTPLYVPYDEIGSFSANLMAKKPDSNNPLFFQTISFKTYDIKNGIVWEANCGIKADDLGVHFVFNLFPADLTKQIFILGWRSAKYDTWYKVKMELNPDTNTIKCFLNENLFHETTPPRLDEIQSSDFFWSLHTFTGNESPYTELWFDDIYRGK